MKNNHEAWNIGGAVKYYESLRNKPEDIYESERVFFFPVIKNVKSVLDVGCAAGGTYNIIKSVNPDISYTGVDVSQGMIESAKYLFPGVDFRYSDGGFSGFSDDSYDAVIALGVLNHVPGYKDFIKECVRISRRYCILDLPRLVSSEHKFSIETSYMILKDRFSTADNKNNSNTKVPYVLVDAAEIFEFLKSSFPDTSIYVKAYYGKCDKSVTIPYNEVCFAVICIDKMTSRHELVIDMPLDIRKRLSEKNIKFIEPFERMICDAVEK